jgi:uncharacterized protein YggE
MTAILVAIVTCVTFTGEVSAQTEVRSVTVSGTGILRVLPDMATVRFGVVTVDDNPENARAMNAQAAGESMNAIRSLGVEDRKMRLDVLRLEPNQVYDENLRRYVEKGFKAVREVSVILEDMDLLPALIASVVEKGANRIQGISYGLTSKRDEENKALKLAVEDARQRAYVMVKTLGSELGQVLRITEQGVDVPQPVLQFERANMAQKTMASDATPEAYSSGEIEIRASVILVFAIEK